METIGKVVVFLGIIVLIAVVLALPTMLLWNWLMPIIFGLGKITFWQALGVNLLAGILTRGNGGTNSK